MGFDYHFYHMKILNLLLKVIPYYIYKCTLINSNSIPTLLLNEFYTNIFHSNSVQTLVEAPFFYFTNLTLLTSCDITCSCKFGTYTSTEKLVCNKARAPEPREVQNNRKAYIRDMEERGKWRELEEEKEGLNRHNQSPFTMIKLDL